MKSQNCTTCKWGQLKLWKEDQKKSTEKCNSCVLYNNWEPISEVKQGPPKPKGIQLFEAVACGLHEWDMWHKCLRQPDLTYVPSDPSVVVERFNNDIFFSRMVKNIMELIKGIYDGRD